MVYAAIPQSGPSAEPTSLGGKPQELRTQYVKVFA